MKTRTLVQTHKLRAVCFFSESAAAQTETSVPTSSSVQATRPRRWSTSAPVAAVLPAAVTTATAAAATTATATNSRSRQWQTTTAATDGL